MTSADVLEARDRKAVRRGHALWRPGRFLEARALLLAALLSLTCLDAFAAPWAVNIDQRNGLPAVTLGGGQALTPEFVFWRKDWAWSGTDVQFSVVRPFEYMITGKNAGLGVDIRVAITKSSESQLQWDFRLDAAGRMADVIGGGMAFKFDLENFAAQIGEPELLPANAGWSWGAAGGPRVEMRFDPPMASIHFERGRKSEIRAYFFQGDVPQGNRRHVATLTVSGGVTIAPTTAERFGLDDPAAWPTGILDWPIAPWNISPVDLSFLNAGERPAGKRGFVKRESDRLVFEDGSPARFWGTNITANALFGTDRENTRRQARRLSELGFNLVRFHHHDSDWVNPNVFGDPKARDTRTLDPAALDKLDWWIKCLKDEGIYVWLDLHVGRELRTTDGVEHFEEIRKGRPTARLKGYNYVNLSIQQLMMRFNEDYLTHLNPYTGLRYRDDPAIIALLLTNENDVTHHFGNALLPNKNVPRHNEKYMTEAASFAARHRLPKDKTWLSWEHGPSKLFLNDLEHRFNVDQIHHLRGFGARSLIATTSTWGFNPLSSLPALTAGDLIAVHSYGGTDELSRNPLYAANLVHWMAAAQVVDRPLAVPEWNVERFPVPDRHAIPLYVAASAGMQGWDAVMQYAYSQQPLSSRGVPSNWHAFNDPALLATVPASALLYRRQDVREASTAYVFAPSPEQFFGRHVSAANSLTLRTAAEKGKLLIALPSTPELPWVEPSPMPAGAKVITDPNLSLIDHTADEVTSDTGELRRNWQQGIFAINTPRTQAAMGWIGGKNITLADTEITVWTRNATVAVQSLDDSPISKAGAVLISLGARAAPKRGSQTPFHSEPVLGRLSIRAPAGRKLYRQHGIAGDARELPVKYENGRYRIELERDLLSYWLILK